MSDNLALWKSVEKTDPAATKQFKGKGGFSGTAISPMWLIHRATEQWGPMGEKWGIRVLSQQVVPGAPICNKDGACVGNESLHVVLAEVYHPGGSIPCFGQTLIVGMNKYGLFTDEEAPKKSLTDALTKGLSWLGFAADVHMGRFDDVKYVNRVMEEFQQEAKAKASDDEKEKLAKIQKGALALLDAAAERGEAELNKRWFALSETQRTAAQQDKQALARIRANAKANSKEVANAAS